MAKLLFTTVLTLFVLSVSSETPCSLYCPTELDLSVGDKCVSGVPDLQSVVSHDGVCSFVSQSVKGGYLPVGDENVRVTVRNMYTGEDEVCDILVKSRDTTKPVVVTSRMTPSAFFGSGRMSHSTLKLKTNENCCGPKCWITDVEVEDDGDYTRPTKCEAAGQVQGKVCRCRQSCGSVPQPVGTCEAGQGLGFGGGKYCGTGVCCCEEVLDRDCKFPHLVEEEILVEPTCLDLPMNEQYKLTSYGRELRFCDGKNDKDHDRTYHITGKCVDASGNESDEFSTEILVTDELSDQADPTCANGVLDSKGEVCCSSTCGGQCGGVGCSLLPGGSGSCCTSTIIENGATCVNGPAPCVM